ncbi:hypothetical protein BU24DRAFT_346093 [Aaosphaeria arxii CBS 175.79]|uniref:Uncharacterized protein n=1 Tax=Aaosphaeria arxii CBS 175.79 TaxID=1450172 RepID=A0A6A5XXG5_9PLEO|nr:uncharacterized protein BU24DRAFT_346093 [Aaosphaeria arxii CBS 175.79]KAF2017649.1 hypothetical protein BU24DRAFT_346093 [Aaosphaeria arxii CBS 175.79]
MSVLARRASTQLLASRSVHLRIQPRPANLSESREILRVLQRFGEISTYKYLRYEYHNPADNIALAIYQDDHGAQQALNASPIRFALERVVVDDVGLSGHKSSGGDLDDETAIAPPTPYTPGGSSGLNSSSGNSEDDMDTLMRPSQLLTQSSLRNQTDASSSPSSSSSSSAAASEQNNHNSASPSPSSSSPLPLPFETPATRPPTAKKWFQVTVDRSRVIHQDFVERQPFWKQFEPTKSTAQEDLAKVVPHPGLSDVSKRPLHHHRTPNHVLKMMSHYVEHVMPSLRQMYEEGGREMREKK